MLKNPIKSKIEEISKTAVLIKKLLSKENTHYFSAFTYKAAEILHFSSKNKKIFKKRYCHIK